MAEEKTPEITAEQVIEVREKIGLTIDQFAQLLNVSARTVQRWEKDGVESGKTAGTAQMMTLFQMSQQEGVFEEFKKLKESLMGAKSAFGAFGNVGLAALSGALPMFGMLAGGAIGSLLAPQIINALQQFVDKKKQDGD